MTEMMLEDDFAASVRTAVQRFTKQSGVEVTAEAAGLIESLLVGFLRDPHPSWNADSDGHRDKADHLVKMLPSYLGQIAKQAAGRSISTYDVLTWVAPNLPAICPYICPFPAVRAS